MASSKNAGQQARNNNTMLEAIGFLTLREY
jgi:hypothetical protein